LSDQDDTQLLPETPPPHFTAEHAREAASRLFAVAGTASPLVGERDQNFRVTAADKTSFVLKISSLGDSANVIDMQTKAMLHIARTAPELPIMRLVPTVGGAPQALLEDSDGIPHIARMFTFMPGRHLQVGELSLHSLHEFGAQSARMGQALRGFFHASAQRALQWDARQTLQLRELLPYLTDTERRRRAALAFDNFANEVEPIFATLRAQVIHNDLSLSNVLFDDQQRVSGILDFGDLVHTALVSDLVTCSESMFERPDPIDALSTLVSGYASVTPLEEVEVRLLPDLLLARWASLAVISAWRTKLYPETVAYVSGWQSGAWAMFDKVDRIGWEAWKQQVRESVSSPPAPGRPHRGGSSVEELAARRRRLFGPAMSPLFYRHPLHLVRGQGAWLYDAVGRAYLDGYNNVPVVGHSHPRVVAAIARQAAVLNTNTRYLHESALELAERLIATLPAALDTVMFVNSGTEANDLAWRLAKSATGGSGGAVTSFAYHGVSTAIAQMSPEEWRTPEPPAHVVLLESPDGYRGRYRYEDPSWPARYATSVNGAVAALAERGHRPAAMFIDTGFTSDGILTPPPAYLQEVCRIWRAAGGLFVADEVQVGFGRTGAHFWGFEFHGLTPDIVTLGKPMGNGHPVAAVITRSDIAAQFARETAWFSTYGGNPVAAEAALAVLDVIEEEGLMRNALVVGEQLRSHLETLADRYQVIGEVRSRGLLIGVDLVRDRATREPAPAAAVVNGMRERGVLIGATGPGSNVLKIRPPLVLTAAEADQLVATLEQVLEEFPGA
jgi:4-aminobutyrate aminotransferase-like enzyme/Ser/Thr protein kinase RdoA (MazF antagonist)